MKKKLSAQASSDKTGKINGNKRLVAVGKNF